MVAGGYEGVKGEKGTSILDILSERVQEMLENPPENLITSQPGDEEMCIDVDAAQRIYEEKVNSAAYFYSNYVRASRYESEARKIELERELKSPLIFKSLPMPKKEISQMDIINLNSSASDAAVERLIKDTLEHAIKEGWLPLKQCY